MILFKLRYARKCEMFILLLCLKAKEGGNRERLLWSHAKMHKTELYCNIGHFIRWLLRLLESNSQEKVRFVLGGLWGLIIPRNKIRKIRPLFVCCDYFKFWISRISQAPEGHSRPQNLQRKLLEQRLHIVRTLCWDSCNFEMRAQERNIVKGTTDPRV